MADDLYKSPSFQFYPGDFIADTADLTAEEVGVYLRLLCHQWKQGGVPSSVTRLAGIGGVTSHKMKKIWAIIFRFFHEHHEQKGVLVQPRLEEIRKESLDRHLRYVEAGRRGGRPPEPTPPLKPWLSDAKKPGLSDAKARPKGLESSPISDLPIVPNGTGETSPEMHLPGTEKPAQLAAWLILDSAWPIVLAEHELAQTRTEWRQFNKRSALSLANSGKTPEQVATMLGVAYSTGRRFYGGITTLAKLIEHWPKLAALEESEDEPEGLMERAIRNGGVKIL